MHAGAKLFLYFQSEADASSAKDEINDAVQKKFTNIGGLGNIRTLQEALKAAAPNPAPVAPFAPEPVVSSEPSKSAAQAAEAAVASSVANNIDDSEDDNSSSSSSSLSTSCCSHSSSDSDGPPSQERRSAPAVFDAEHGEETNERSGTSLSNGESHGSSSSDCPSSQLRSSMLATENEEVNEKSRSSSSLLETTGTLGSDCPSSHERRSTLLPEHDDCGANSGNDRVMPLDSGCRLVQCEPRKLSDSPPELSSLPPTKRLHCENLTFPQRFQSESVTSDPEVQETIDALLSLAEIVEDGGIVSC